jgi:hypothetical protein
MQQRRSAGPAGLHTALGLFDLSFPPAEKETPRRRESGAA